MAKSLTKVQKHIAKKKGKNVALHENSRDSRRLQRSAARDDKLARLAAVRSKQNQPLLQRVFFFHTAVKEREPPFTIATVQDLVNEYLHRDDEELTTLKSQRRAGRPPSTQEVIIKQRQSEEAGEHKAGLWLPDIEDAKNVELLKEWNGEWSGLNTMKYVRLASDGTKHPSSFPPKGSS